MIFNIQCRTCKDILLVDHVNGSIECNCGALQATYLEGKRTIKTKNALNIVYLDDAGNEVILDMQDERRTDIIRSLEEMIHNYDNLSSNAMMMPANQYDIHTILLIIRSVLTL